MDQSLLTAATTPGPVPQRRARATPVWMLHSGMSVSRFIAMHALGAIFPVSAGLLLYSWRALSVILVVLGSTAAAIYIWRRIGSRGRQVRYDQGMWLGLLLAMTLPAHLLGDADPATGALLWPALPAAGFILVIFIWLLGGVGSGRVHPVLVTHLLLFICFKELLVPHHVLQRSHVFTGDLFNAMPAEMSADVRLPWIQARDVPEYDSIHREPASQVLGAFTRGGDSLQQTWVSLDALLRDRMPPLEDLIVAGHPAPIGIGSAIAIIVGGLFLLYRGLIDYRVPLLIVISAIGAIIVLPVPVVVDKDDAVWRWVAMRQHDVGWEVGLTLVSYEIMAGPLLFMAFFLATSTTVRPITRRARTIYAVLTGVLAGALQLYVSLSIGPYLALLAASLLTPTLDKLFRPRTLV